ncbi:DNA topoisomerase IV [Christiangramia sabulilitoris]|uniref:DNA topoisomerase IV n=1 Tax=Christiangramia sabulilitoris TaxID=2583991 RepID=A0A550I6H3_9FLAO|nr:DNA topoisomerase IV [Christiangramia sabulilitoris]TRO66577.1 DNA topoisomerase IV [Christiangramia sabulilitoris]
MKKLAAFFCLLPFFSCFSPERNCEDFRTGTYEFESFINGELLTSRFIRNDSIEIEQFMGKTDTSSVRWINDCEYILKNINPDGMAEEKPIHIKILTTSKEGYTFEYGQVGNPRKEKGKVRKVSGN